MHCGPFANIAHGTSSVLAQRHVVVVRAQKRLTTIDDPEHPEETRLLAALPDEALDHLVATVNSPVEPLLPGVELRQLGGAYAQDPPVRSALCHRDAAFNLHLVGMVPDEQAVPAVAGAIAAALAGVAPWSTGATLPNFVASDDPARIRRCYDDDTAAWLAALADQFDPKGVLRVGPVMRS